MASSRESRRKRIVERSSDRLAFITGLTNSFPSQRDEDFPQTLSLPTSANVSTAHDKDDASGSVPPKREASNEAAGNLLDSHGNVTRSISSSVQDSSNAVSSSIQTSSISSVSTEPQPAPRPNTHRPIFTPDQIISSISASENIRLICSAIIGFLVVLSHGLYPRGFISMITYRPIYLVLVTDLTIVLGLPFANSSNKIKIKPTINTDAWADNVGKALELGFVLQNVMNALFMDFSICAVLLISGLSLLRLG